MNKVTTINLGGKAYQLEEAAYEHLQHYLTHAKATLAGDPDKDEIVHDLEQAIGEKCDQHLTGNKNVVTAKEMSAILKSMGPVEPAEDEPTPEKNAVPEQQQPTRRLYLLREGSVIGGVCAGLGAYFNVDVTMVRLVFILLTVITSGAWILAYLLMLVIIPEAETPEERAAAHGERFSAQELVAKAKHKYADLKSDEHWSRVAQETGPAFSRVGRSVLRITRFAAGCAAAILGIVIGISIVVWLWVLGSITFGHIHLYDQLRTIAPWILLLTATAIFYAWFLPITLLAAAFRRHAKAQRISKKEVWWSVASVMMWIVALLTLLTVGIVNGPRVRDFQRTHGYLRIGDSQICINDVRCK